MKTVSTDPNSSVSGWFDLHGKTAWVVGAGGLLGTEVSRGLAQQGAHVVLSDLRDDRVEALAAELRGAGLSAESNQLDIGCEEAILNTLDKLLQAHGRIDIMVNMTYFYKAGDWRNLSAGDFEACMKVSLTGAFIISRECCRVMAAAGGGSIIQFSSMYGVVSPDPAMYPPPQPVNPIDYGIAKAGILQMVRYQAVQMARMGVRVNAIIPGPFPIPEKDGRNREFMERLAAKVPMGRVGQPREIVGAVLYLAADASSYVTGTALTVDGGWTAW